ncbi:hypothetical protein BDV27DRAFT_5454 [Aspergillus caelatus]|uniref:Uncharacterized protein n=2 Tax=Aspergillus subgen. Circumdati TaxID=2720871 RepID=A0A5N7AKD2_9EURO|nr:uncharacterized protein BDV27DRAFT_5454 [Aspergillus caelatus]KAE8369459.1 hypothetical protein BDV27DRAFT_5454 [Aspergillus caelatus]KAE8410408.1 hypothetical protein BDV36DRAFT_123130 [Aspergillus pseudocaelatus]
MYTNTPTHKFLVLSPIYSGPMNDQVESKEPTRERSSSQSSTTSTGSQLRGAFSPLPGGFLYLGHEQERN